MIDRVRAANGRNVLFFVEESRISVANNSATDVPVRDEHWLTSDSRTQLLRQFEDAGGDRSITVRSTIALHLPGRVTPLQFNGETTGRLAATPPAFLSSRIYPWLSPQAFDAWFIADGSEKRLGEMGADESLRFHFRARALHSLAQRLAEFSAVLNLPRTAYRLQHRSSSVGAVVSSESPPRFIVIGERAAGKTTFGDVTANALDAHHYEASTIIRLYHRELHPDARNISEFVEQLHQERGDDLVIRMLAEKYGLLDSPLAVVTGIRRFADLLYLACAGISYQLIYVEANAHIRYARYLQRAREESVMSLETFLTESAAHAAALQFARRMADVRIKNDYDLDHYLAQIDYVVRRGKKPARPKGLRFQRKQPDRSLLMHAAQVVSQSATALTSEEIATHLASHGVTATEERIGRLLNGTRGIFTRAESQGRVTYRALSSAARLSSMPASERRK